MQGNGSSSSYKKRALQKSFGNHCSKRQRILAASHAEFYSPQLFLFSGKIRTLAPVSLVLVSCVILYAGILSNISRLNNGNMQMRNYFSMDVMQV